MPVYFASNPCVQPHEEKLRKTHWLWKVGFTKHQNPEDRWKGSTDAPIPYEVPWAITGMRTVEKKIHNELSKLGFEYRLSGGGREFFAIPHSFDIGKFLAKYVKKNSHWLRRPSDETHFVSPARARSTEPGQAHEEKIIHPWIGQNVRIKYHDGKFYTAQIQHIKLKGINKVCKVKYSRDKSTQEIPLSALNISKNKTGNYSLTMSF